MKSNHFLQALLTIAFIVFSHSTFAQEEAEVVKITITSLDDQIVHTFKDQRHIAPAKAEGFAIRMTNLYDYVDKITYNPADHSFSIHFVNEPSKEELEDLFVHFHVNEYSFVKKQ